MLNIKRNISAQEDSMRRVNMHKINQMWTETRKFKKKKKIDIPTYSHQQWKLCKGKWINVCKILKKKKNQIILENRREKIKRIEWMI